MLDEGLGDDGKTAGRGRPKTDDSSVLNSAQSYREEGKTRTQVAKAVGLKRDKYSKIKHVHDTAKDETQPEPIRQLAKQQMAALDAGKATAHAADRALRKAGAGRKRRFVTRLTNSIRQPRAQLDAINRGVKRAPPITSSARSGRSRLRRRTVYSRELPRSTGGVDVTLLPLPFPISPCAGSGALIKSSTARRIPELATSGFAPPHGGIG